MFRSKAQIALIVLAFPVAAFCQVPRKNFDPDSFSASDFVELKKEYGTYKHYPQQIERQVLIALSFYPELKHVPILFRIAPQHSLGFTRVTLGGLFESPHNKHYIVTISDSTENVLMPLMFKNLSFNAQIALIGHELGHVADPSTETTLEILKHVVGSVSARHIDRFEYNTDAICIAHGLGYQLLEWSRYVRETMHSVNWDGPDYVHRPKKRERYMNPSTIEKKIAENPIYDSIR